MFDAIVAAMTLIAIGFLAAWWRSPEIRDWMESPKYRFLGRSRNIPKR
jgi:hypothetical protein